VKNNYLIYTQSPFSINMRRGNSGTINEKKARMRFKTHLLVFVLFLSCGIANAQYNIHWTLFDMSPLSLNPAKTGAYEGTFRVGGIYRDQDNFIAGAKGYRTPLVFVDAPILWVRKKDWIGIGGMYYADKSGSLGLGQNFGAFSAAYHLSTNTKTKSYLSLGIQIGSGSRTIDTDNPNIFTSDFKNGSPDQTERALFNGNGNSYSDRTLGLTYTTKVDKKTSFNAGFAVSHFGKVKYAFQKTATDPNLPLMTTVHAELTRVINKKLSVTPQLMYRTTKKAQELAIQAIASYDMKPDDANNPVFRGGLGYRTFGNDLQILLGADLKNNIRIAASYDIETSGLRQARTANGFELGFWYTVKKYKKPTIKPVYFCPLY
jgi:type IX secretion system PorP/SprF family membrane protein